MSVLRRIRDEFRLDRFFPRYHDPTRFYTTPWLTNQKPFLVYRLLLCVYNLTVLVLYPAGSYWAWNPKVLITLSYQTYILWTIYSIWSAVVCFVLYFASPNNPVDRQTESYSLTSSVGFSQEVQESSDNAAYRRRREDTSRAKEPCDTATPAENTVNDSDSRFGTTLDAAALLQGYLRDDSNNTTTDTVTSPPEPRLPWYLAWQWVLYTAPAVAALPITVIFWFLIMPTSTAVDMAGDILIHTMNSVTVFLELFLTGVPIRLLHVVYAIFYLLMYSVFNVIYVYAGGTDREGNPYIYKVFDFKGNLSLAFGFTVAVAGLFLVSHVIVFFLSLLRDKIHSLVASRQVRY